MMYLVDLSEHGTNLGWRFMSDVSMRANGTTRSHLCCTPTPRTKHDILGPAAPSDEPCSLHPSGTWDMPCGEDYIWMTNKRLSSSRTVGRAGMR